MFVLYYEFNVYYIIIKLIFSIVITQGKEVYFAMNAL
jgi:hypothetical protein